MFGSFCRTVSACALTVLWTITICWTVVGGELPLFLLLVAAAPLLLPAAFRRKDDAWNQQK